MVWYAMLRINSSHGQPVSLNQTAMAKYFGKRKKLGKRKRRHSSGPSRRTIIRAWSEFAVAMAALGHELVRVHSVGVDEDGKKRTGTNQRKLGWVCFSTSQQTVGAEVYRYANQWADPAAGVPQPFRWPRSANGALLDNDCDPQMSSVPILPPIPLISLAGSKQISQNEQHAPAAQSQSEELSPASEHPILSERPVWWVPEWVRRTIWGLARQRLGQEAEPLAFRALALWKAGMDKKLLFDFLSRARDWGGAVQHGNKGAVAAAYLAKLVMKTGGSPTEMPYSEQFAECLQLNTTSMRGRTARRCNDYLTPIKQKFYKEAGIRNDNLRRLLWKSAGLTNHRSGNYESAESELVFSALDELSWGDLCSRTQKGGWRETKSAPKQFQNWNAQTTIATRRKWGILLGRSSRSLMDKATVF